MKDDLVLRIRVYQINHQYLSIDIQFPANQLFDDTSFFRGIADILYTVVIVIKKVQDSMSDYLHIDVLTAKNKSAPSTEKACTMCIVQGIEFQ